MRLKKDKSKIALAVATTTNRKLKELSLGTVEELVSAVRTLETNLALMQEYMNSLSSDMVDLTNTIDTLSQTVSTQADSITSLTQRVTALEQANI
jgi:prefoldin subunit 5